MKYRDHNEAMRAAEEKFQIERDKRYAEVNIEREKALKIKETADLAALSLAREIQTYKDDKADKTREQNLTERGAYVTHDDLTQVFTKSEENLAAVFKEIKIALKPMIDHIAADSGATISTGKLYASITVIVIIIGVIYTIINYAVK